MESTRIKLHPFRSLLLSKTFPRCASPNLLRQIQFIFAAQFFALCATLMLSTNASAAEKKLIHDAQYTGEYKSIDIVMSRKLRQVSDDTYKLETKAKNFLGSVVEYETFTWTPETGIRPTEYYYKQKIFGIKKVRRINFDWDKNTARSEDKDKKATLDLKPGMLGPLTYQLQMQLDMLNKPEIDAERTLDYHFINRNKIKHYIFSLDTDLLEQKPELKKNAVVLKRKNEGSNKTTRLWLNPQDYFTLIKLEQIKGKNSHTLNFEKGNYHYPLEGTPYGVSSEDEVSG